MNIGEAPVAYSITPKNSYGSQPEKQKQEQQEQQAQQAKQMSNAFYALGIEPTVVKPTAEQAQFNLNLREQLGKDKAARQAGRDPLGPTGTHQSTGDDLTG
jgi:hypothetical protein